MKEYAQEHSVAEALREAEALAVVAGGSVVEALTDRLVMTGRWAEQTARRELEQQAASSRSARDTYNDWKSRLQMATAALKGGEDVRLAYAQEEGLMHPDSGLRRVVEHAGDADSATIWRQVI